MTPRVGSAAWNAARLAWRDVATASARALIARRVDGLRRDSLEASTFLEAGTHEVPTARGTERQAEPNDAWPPETRDRESPELAAAHHRQRHRRHVVDGVWPAERCGALASSAASALAPLRDRHGEASVAALGWASRDILGDAAFAEMRDALSAMRREAERAFSFGARGGEQTVTENGKGKARRLYPVGALLTHIVPAADATRHIGAAGTRGATRQTSTFGETRYSTRYSYAAAGTGYWSPHVDKANVPEYDVSAILYLSDGGGFPPGATSVNHDASGARGWGDFRAEFSGGTLVFLDDDDDDDDDSLKKKKSRRGEDDPPRKKTNAFCKSKTFCVGITPRRGRLVVFASGEENVHAVSVVETGARATLNLWLTADKRVGADERVFDRELWRGDDAEA